MNILLVNSGETFDDAWDYLAGYQVGTTCLLDPDQSMYSSYTGVEAPYAPFPQQVVIDRDGVITYLSTQYDADAVRAAIDAAL